MKKSLMRSLAIVFLLYGIAQLSADNISFNGYGRSKAGALLSDWSVFMQENTLDARFSWDTDTTLLYANLILATDEDQIFNTAIRELYLHYYGDSFDIRIGKQQIIWGKSDAVFITDLVSPKDLSRFLVPDFEELRLAATGVRANLYSGNHQLEVVWLPLFTPTVQPAADSLWAPALPFPVQPTFLPSIKPDLKLSNGEYFARYSWLGSSVDFSLMGGWFWNDTPSFSVVSKTITPSVGLTALSVQGEYYRTASAGYGLSARVGPVVLKSEGAFYFNKRYQGNIAIYPQGYTEKNAIHYLVGTDFSISGTTLGLQFIQEIILDHEAALVDEAFTNTATLLLARSFARDTVRLEALTYIGFAAPDALIKPQVTWKITDGMEIAAGGWFFLGDSGAFGQYSDNSSIFASAKIYF